jgi:hypothetical protein
MASPYVLVTRASLAAILLSSFLAAGCSSSADDALPCATPWPAADAGGPQSSWGDAGSKAGLVASDTASVTVDSRGVSDDPCSPVDETTYVVSFAIGAISRTHEVSSPTAGCDGGLGDGSTTSSSVGMSTDQRAAIHAAIAAIVPRVPRSDECELGSPSGITIREPGEPDVAYVTPFWVGDCGTKPTVDEPSFDALVGVLARSFSP